MKNSVLRRSEVKWVGPSLMALMMTLSVTNGANADTGVRPFQTYVAQGYTEVANYAAFQMGNNKVAKHFQNKAQFAQSGGWVDPENPTSFTSRWGVDIAKARNLLIEILSSDQLKHNPEMAAIALVNFDCFVTGVGQDGKPCLDAFAAALAALRPAITNTTLQSNDKDQLDSARSFAPPDRGRAPTQPDDAENNPGDNPPIGIGIGSGDDTGNGTVVGVAIGAGDRSGQGGLIGASVLSGNQSGIGGLVGASVLSGKQSGQGGLVGISALSGENSGKGGIAGISVLSGPPGNQDIAKIDISTVQESVTATKDAASTAVNSTREAIANVGGSLHGLNQTFDTAAVGIATGENSPLGRTANDILGALGARSNGSSPSSSGQSGSDGSNGGGSGSASGGGSNSGGNTSASNGGVGGAAGSVGGAVGGAIDSIGSTVGGIGEGLGGALGGLGDGLGGLGGSLGGN